MDTLNMEYMVEAAIEAPHKPGLFRLDVGALRNLLVEIVKLQQQTGDGPKSILKATTDKLVSDVNSLQENVLQLDSDLQQVRSATELASKFEEQVCELRDNERIISDSIEVLAENLQALQEQVEGFFQEDTGTLGGHEGSQVNVVTDLMERVQALETRSARRISKSWKEMDSTSGSARRRTYSVKRKWTIVDVRSNLNSLNRKLSVEPNLPPEPKLEMATYFEELKAAITQMGMERMASVEDFLSAIKNHRYISPSMLQELMVIFSGLDVDFFSLMVTALNESPSLSVPAVIEVLEFLLSSAFDANAFAILFTQLSNPSSHITLQSFRDLLTCFTMASRITPSCLAAFLDIVVNLGDFERGQPQLCEGLMTFLEDIKDLSSYSWEAIVSIAEEVHFSKNKTLKELVEIMDKMSASELTELMSMLLTIPGYISELMYSLPKTPSLSTQKLLERLISLPNNAPQLVSEILELMVKEPKLKSRLVVFVSSVLDLIAAFESERRSMSGFYALLVSVHSMESITLKSIKDFLALTTEPNNIPMNALKALVQFSRDSPNKFINALADILGALLGNPDVKGDVLVRLLRLMEKSKLVSPRPIKELLGIMDKTGLLKQPAFDQLMELFRWSPFSTPYAVSDFLTTIQSLDFLTLEDLSHALFVTQSAIKRTYEEALERQARRDFELFQMKKMSDGGIKTEEQIDRSPDDVSIDDVVKDMQDMKEVQNNILERLDCIKPSKSDISISRKVSETIPATESPPLMAPSETQLHKVPSRASDVFVQDIQKELRDLQSTVNTLVEEIKAKDQQKKSKKRSGSDTKKPYAKRHPDVRKVIATQDLAFEDSIHLYDKKLETPIESSENLVSESFSETPMFLGNTILRNEIARLDTAVQRLDLNTKEFYHHRQLLEDELTSKASIAQLLSFKHAVNTQLHNFARKDVYWGPAGVKRKMRVNCLSCDKEDHSVTEPVMKTLPHQRPFPPVLSQRPHNIYEMDLVRRHARSLLEGKMDHIDYSLPRSCGGQHTSINVRHMWTCEIHKESNGMTKGMDGRMYTGASVPPSNDIKVDLTAKPMFSKSASQCSPRTTKHSRL